MHFLGDLQKLGLTALLMAVTPERRGLEGDVSTVPTKMHRNKGQGLLWEKINLLLKMCLGRDYHPDLHPFPPH